MLRKTSKLSPEGTSYVQPPVDKLSQMELNSAFLALIATLVGAGIWTVKALMARSDKLIESRDKHIESAITALTEAVQAFSRFETGEVESHQQIVKALGDIAQVQASSLILLNTIIEKLNQPCQP